MNWRSVTLTVLVTAFLVWNLRGPVTHAQQVPQTNGDGIPYLKVNINPTAVPPAVNINPEGRPPRVLAAIDQPVQVSRLPDVHVLYTGCDNPANFDTGVGQRISGPIRLTFLSIPKSTVMDLVDTNGRSYRVPFNPTSQIGSTIQLRAGQRLEFDSDVMYSGCRPVD